MGAVRGSGSLLKFSVIASEAPRSRMQRTSLLLKINLRLHLGIQIASSFDNNKDDVGLGI